ncbi:MAG: hypothetical protein LC777_22210, partial [Actinobacteria bacterium]|nr:hypothetical protein [Actinomycetota bacterium]
MDNIQVLVFPNDYTGYERPEYDAATRTMRTRRSQEERLIVHEFGHHLEEMLPPEVWIGVLRLLQKRAKDQPLVAFKAADKVMADPSEVRYQADMPVTTPYSAKYMESGSTEILSMAMEKFATGMLDMG